jgi:hypothetical protein
MEDSGLLVIRVIFRTLKQTPGSASIAAELSPAAAGGREGGSLVLLDVNAVGSCALDPADEAGRIASPGALPTTPSPR